MIVKRPFWQKLIEDAWLQKSIIWLMGVRRVGKTSLCKSLDNIEYFDCELARVRKLFNDSEEFLKSNKGKKIVIDEIHHLDNPSQLLKIAADYYPDIKIIATGSSTLGASAKFKDTLTGRKREIWLTPMLLEEMSLFGNEDLRHRFLFGGFPSYFVQKDLPEDEFKEWINAYWAKDIEEMFTVGKRYSFLKFAELLLAYSGSQFDASKYADVCGISRHTVANYLSVLEETLIVQVIRPFSTHKPSEIVKAPKVYGFDTGFVCYAKGWREMRKEDLGIFWEHCVLNEINAHLQTRSINYWRDKQGHEVDFILRERGNTHYTAIECKFSSLQTDLRDSVVANAGKNIEAFRHLYPQGENFVVASNVDIPFVRRYKDITLSFVNTDELISRLKSMKI